MLCIEGIHGRKRSIMRLEIVGSLLLGLPHSCLEKDRHDLMPQDQLTRRPKDRSQVQDR